MKLSYDHIILTSGRQYKIIGRKLSHIKLIAQCKAAVTPLLMHWSYHSRALSHRNALTTHIGLIFQLGFKLPPPN